MKNYWKIIFVRVEIKCIFAKITRLRYAIQKKSIFLRSLIIDVYEVS